MISQIFKKHYECENMYEFLEKICTKVNNKFIFNQDAYKRCTMFQILTPFLENILPYYYISKQHYVERKMSYKNLSTIFRQICRINNIPFHSKLKYNRSSYEIIYYIQESPI